MIQENRVGAGIILLDMLAITFAYNAARRHTFVGAKRNFLNDEMTIVDGYGRTKPK